MHSRTARGASRAFASPHCQVDGILCSLIGTQIIGASWSASCARGGSMKMIRSLLPGLLAVLIGTVAAPSQTLAQQQRKPNILVIMGDDVGWFNIGAYHRGMMSG